MDIAKFKKLPVMGIMRGIDIDIIDPLVGAVAASGLQTIEITMNSPRPDEAIKKAVKTAAKTLMVGAGTVLNLDDLKKALDSGATFIVMPTLIGEVMDYCVSKVIPVFPGAITPTEIYNAWNAGATMVKVFPSGYFGPSYIKEIRGPFDRIELLACGGVDSKNIGEYFECGASAVSFGASIFKKELLDAGNFKSIVTSIKKLLAGVPKR